jgi:ABC-type glutathione transport system ATPase component
MTSRQRPQLHPAPDTRDPAAPPAVAAPRRAHLPMPPAPHAANYPEHLPATQRQRLAIGRATAPRPAPALADEPSSNLDEAPGDRVLGLLPELPLKLGTTLPLPPPSDRPAFRRLHLSKGSVA